MKRNVLLLLCSMGAAGASGLASAAAPAPAAPIKASDVAAVTAPLNPLTGQPISAETLSRLLKVKTLQADIATQDLKRVRAERQMNGAGPVPGVAGSPPAAPGQAAPAVKDKPKPRDKHHKPAESHAAPPAAPVSPVAGILTENGVRYALLQIHGQGKMARVGDTFMGHHVNAVTASTVTIDGLIFRPDQAVSTIANVQPATPVSLAAGGARGPRPIYPPLPGPLPQLPSVLGNH